LEKVISLSSVLTDIITVSPELKEKGLVELLLLFIVEDPKNEVDVNGFSLEDER
jgi:hypothetical protein